MFSDSLITALRRIKIEMYAIFYLPSAPFWNYNWQRLLSKHENASEKKQRAENLNDGNLH